MRAHGCRRIRQQALHICATAGARLTAIHILYMPAIASLCGRGPPGRRGAGVWPPREHQERDAQTVPPSPLNPCAPRVGPVARSRRSQAPLRG
eukprot:51893-Chlamydomonas_euryale.AAC.2